MTMFTDSTTNTLAEVLPVDDFGFWRFYRLAG